MATFNVNSLSHFNRNKGFKPVFIDQGARSSLMAAR
jgi:hypothetical protein